MATKHKMISTLLWINARTRFCRHCETANDLMEHCPHFREWPLCHFIDDTDINNCPQMKETQQNLTSRSQQRQQSSDTEGQGPRRQT